MGSGLMRLGQVVDLERGAEVGVEGDERVEVEGVSRGADGWWDDDDDDDDGGRIYGGMAGLIEWGLSLSTNECGWWAGWTLDYALLGGHDHGKLGGRGLELDAWGAAQSEQQVYCTARWVVCACIRAFDWTPKKG